MPNVQNKAKKTVNVTLTSVPLKIYQKIKRAADREKRSWSAQANLILEKAA